LTEEVLGQFNVVIFTDFYDREKLIQYNEFCRSKGIAFIYTGSLGLYGFGFVDFGDNHVVLDKDGEELKSCMVSHISQEKEAVVTVHE
jgi:ubiquitin-activating enzyme E1